MGKKIILFSISILILVMFFSTTCNAQNYEDYAPIFYFEGEETCYPVDASYHLDNSIRKCIEDAFDETCYYDNTHGTINDEGVINHYRSVMSSYGYTVYYREYSSGSTDVIQYWMFYAFNKGELNQHEGDWEMVQIVFENSQPSWVGYSQHHSGQRATWSQVEKEGNHIKVYVARGSHANYLRSYSGKLGIASDIIGANGKILNPSDYDLDDIESETWINDQERWGEVANTEADAIQALLLGQAGPEGPMYREDGAMWNDPVSWGNSLIAANDLLFILEWLIYNFVTLFILISVAILALLIFKIYRRHKKYGLGPRVVSMLYINGFNLHTIGNILCIAGIIIAIFGLFNPWYNVSYGVSGTGITETFQTEGMVDLLKFDGINGLQMTIPGTDGPTPMGSFVLPFSLFIAIGLIFLIIATIGIPLSKKLGTKYIWRGVRLIIPFILIVIAIMLMGSLVPSAPVGGESGTNYMQDILGSISGSPFGGETTVPISESIVDGQISLQWGLGSGGWQLLTAGIILIVAGILELMSKTQFFATKTPLPGKAPPQMPPQQPPAAQQPPPVAPYPPPPQRKVPPKGKSKGNFCNDCGARLGEKSTFCVNCGKKF